MRKTARAIWVTMILAAVMMLSVCCALAEEEFVVENGRLTAYNGEGGEVYLPYGVTTIASGAFANNTEITYINLPETIQEIEPYAFSGCTKLGQVFGFTKGDAIGKGAFFGCTNINGLYLPEGMTEIPAHLFYNCENLTSYSIPDTVEVIGTGAFYGCDSLKTFNFPLNLREIGTSAFGSCDNLSNITFSESVQSVGEYAFYNCNKLKNVTFLSSVTAIGSCAFPQWDSSLTLYSYEGSTAQSYAEANGNSFALIQDTSLESDFEIYEGRLTGYTGNGGHVTIPDGVTEISNDVFQNRHDLLSVTMPDTVTRIGMNAFYGCTNLKSVQLSENLTHLAFQAFYGCKNLSSISLPASLQVFGEASFYGCLSLTNIVIPGGADLWNCSQFENCFGLTSVVFEEGITSLTWGMFKNCTNLTNVQLPSTLKEINPSAFSNCKQLSYIALPDGLETLGGGCFSDCAALTSITIPGSVTTIGGSAFSNCTALTSITIPGSVTSIGGSAFSNCTALTNAYLSEGITSTSYKMFYGCTSLVSVNLPESLETVDGYAFENCSALETITFPANIESIGVGALANCTSLRSITFSGKDTQFDGIFWGDHQFPVVYGHYGSDAEDFAKDHALQFMGCDCCEQVNPCAHENTCLGYSSRNHIYTSTGDLKTHFCTYDEYRYTYCDDCGAAFDHVLIEGIEKTEDHYWNDEGYCSGCEQVNTCQHENTRQNTYPGNHDYASTGDYGTHQMIYDEYAHTYCVDCGLFLGESVVAEGVITTENHSWNKNKICYNCKQENRCTHPEKESYTYGENYQYIPTGNHRYHLRSYDIYRVTLCSVCNLHLSDAFEETNSYDSEHTWNEKDVCEYCEQPNTCQHEKTEEYTDTSSEYEPLDDTIHAEHLTVSVVTRCSTCRKDLFSREAGEYTFEKNHWLSSDGICYNCDAECAPCTHEKLNKIQTNYEQLSAKDLGDGTHQVIDQESGFYHCAHCGMSFRDNTWTETNVRIQPHDYPNRCDACGYTVPCAHTDTRISTKWLDSRWESIDNLYHGRYGRREEYEYCRDCGLELRVTEYRTEELQYEDIHTWEDGECSRCGYENPCEHAHTTYALSFAAYSAYKAQNASVHTETILCYEHLRCADCGDSVGQIGQLKEVVKTYPHSFDDGVCYDCGYQNGCTHDGGTYQKVYIGDWQSNAIMVNEHTHRIYCTEITSTYCSLCNELLNEQESDVAWHEYPHEIYAARCDYCAYEVACAHENIGLTNLPNIYDDSRYSTSVSDTHHETICDLYLCKICFDCGSFLYSQNGHWVGMTTETEPHNFIGNVCSDCGYEKIIIPPVDPSYAGTIDGPVFFNLDWNEYKDEMAQYGLTRGGTATLMDLKTGISMSVHIQSAGNHADVEPLSANDTDAMCRMYGVSSADQISWQRRAAVLTLAHGNVNIRIVCSIYGEPHGAQDITDNNYEGQFCLHFLNSTVHSGDGVSPNADHQAMIQKAVDVLRAQGKTCKTTLTAEDVGELKADLQYKTRQEILVMMGADPSSVYEAASTGGAVLLIQQIMQEMGIYDGAISGNYGSRTQSAVISFQESRGLATTGVCDYETIVNLIEVYLGNTGPVCLHPDTYENLMTGEQVYTYIDETHHEHTFDGFIRVYCRACNQDVEKRFSTPFAQTELHRFGDDGLCSCGYADPDYAGPCPHESTTPDIYKAREWVYEDLGDGLHHKTIITGDTYNVCDACGANVGERYTHTFVNVHEHDYPNGCPSCGFFTDCDHERTRTLTEYTDEETYPIDETRHGTRGFLVTTVDCLDCGTILSEETAEEATLYRIGLHRQGSCYCGAENANPCAHENQSVILQNEWINDAWARHDAATHARICVYSEITVCTDCGTQLGGSSGLRQEMVYEPHVFDVSGECIRCRFRNPCAHTGTTHEERERGEWYGTYFIDENTHMEDAHYNVSIICDDCGQPISTTETGREQHILPHKFEEGECAGCYYAPCLHENMQYKTVVNKQAVLYATPISANAHALTCEKQLFTYCPDCDSLLNYSGTPIGMATVYQSHEVFGGKCVVCAMCVHPQELRSTEVTASSTDTLYYNAYLHEYTETRHCVETCGLCGEMLREWNESEVTRYASHRWDDSNECAVCGTTNSCTHTNAYRATSSGGNAEYEDTDSDGHLRFLTPSTYMYCPDCLRTWDHGQGEVMESFQKHSYGSRITECRYCGHINTCAHTNVTEETTLEDVTGYDYVDAYTHAVRGTIYAYDSCEDCGAYGMNERLVAEDTVYMTELHGYGSDGVCDCGDTHICTHENTVETYIHAGSYTRQLDASHHADYALYSLYSICADCGLELATLGQTTQSVQYMEHHFNSAGFCQDCHYQSACAHTRTYTVNKDECWEYTPVDEQLHQMLIETYAVTYCADCGVETGGTVTGLRTVTQPHNAGSCGCSLCGYSDGTAHANAEQREVAAGIVSASAVDAHSHKAVVNLFVADFCTDCGKQLSEDKYAGVVTRTVPHNFGATDRCTDCGYVTTCAHSETVVEQTASYAHSYAPHSAQLHTWLQGYNARTRCADCSKLVDGYAANDVPTAGEHTLTNGVCRLCGYADGQYGSAITLTLPARLTAIETEAFAGSPFASIICPDGLQRIGARAFADCSNLQSVTIPASVTSIDDSAFEGCGSSLVIICEAGSEAERFAAAHGFPCFIGM